ncbi:hypothetical protein [Pseudarthrobacter sp. S9]|uniref:hypothetical protein n=1 Tax=Pseudarthrobacter sp. S9 TaxID=3418421 RepID=UPI003D018CD6
MKTPTRCSSAPKIVRKALTMGAVFALTTAGLLAGSAPASAASYLGGVDMQRACNTQYYDAFHYRAEILNQYDAYSWRCVNDGDTTNKIDVDLACMIQYGAGARAGLVYWWDPHSWYCQR